MADRYATNGEPSKLFDWIAQRKPHAIVGYRLDVGTVSLVSPRTQPLDPTSTPCEEARHARALIVVMTSHAIDSEERANMDRLIASCGVVLFNDGSGTIIEPRSNQTVGSAPKGSIDESLSYNGSPRYRYRSAAYGREVTRE